MIKTVYFIVVAYGAIIDWAGPVPAISEPFAGPPLTAMEVCVKAAGEVQQWLLQSTDYNGIPVDDVKLGCYNVDQQPIVGEPLDD